jgi:hypothetical protein
MTASASDTDEIHRRGHLDIAIPPTCSSHDTARVSPVMTGREEHQHERGRRRGGGHGVSRRKENPLVSTSAPGGRGRPYQALNTSSATSATSQISSHVASARQRRRTARKTVFVFVRRTLRIGVPGTDPSWIHYVRRT